MEREERRGDLDKNRPWQAKTPAALAPQTCMELGREGGRSISSDIGFSLIPVDSSAAGAAGEEVSIRLSL